MTSHHLAILRFHLSLTLFPALRTRCVYRTKMKTASGPDGISSHMLRKTSSSIHNFFSYLFNKSIETGVFPEEWKTSNVTTIFKAGDPKLASNYRPISLLSLLSKVLERIVHNEVVEYLTFNLASGVADLRQFYPGGNPPCYSRLAPLIGHWL